MSSRSIKVALAEQYAAQLDALAASTGERVATIAGQLIRYALSEAVKDGRIRQPRPASQAAGRSGGGGRAHWLEPYGGDTGWRAEMWGQIVALHGRYPRALSHLKDEWWNDEANTEILCSLATWRAEIDDNGTDPRQELAFHTALADYGNLLRQEGGGVAKAWEPGAPPSEWTR
jgi:hypothetical protein